MKQIEPAVMTVGELAEYLRVDRSTIYRLIQKNKLPAFRLGSDYRFHREALEQWLKEQQVGTETAEP